MRAWPWAVHLEAPCLRDRVHRPSVGSLQGWNSPRSGWPVPRAGPVGPTDGDVAGDHGQAFLELMAGPSSAMTRCGACGTLPSSAVRTRLIGCSGFWSVRAPNRGMELSGRGLGAESAAEVRKGGRDAPERGLLSG